MKLKKIELHNFRQYEHELIEFSTDKSKNVTLIIGEVGAGKSTLEQAFKFVLYNRTNFTNPILLNEMVKKKLPINTLTEVSVMLNFEFKSEEYSIKRSIKYLKLSNNSMVTNDPKLVGWKIINGNSQPLSDTDLLSVIAKMIPEKLSTYFFLDGEKVETLATSLNNLGKQDDFKEVVTRLLGLEYLQNAIFHLKKDRKSVIKLLEKEADEFGDSRLANLNDQQEKKYAEILSKYNEKTELANSINIYRDQKNKLEGIIGKVPQAQELFRKYQELESDISSSTTEKLEEKFSFRNLNNHNFANFLSIPLIKNVAKDLSENLDIDFGVPEINSKTIDYIEKNKKCICGQEILENGNHWHNLEKLREYLPPNSIGTLVNNFIKSSEEKVNSSEGFFDNLDNLYKQRRQQLNTIDEKKMQFQQLSSLLDDLNIINQKKVELDNVNRDLRESESRKDSIIKLIGQLELEQQKISDEINVLREQTITSKKKLNSLKTANQIAEKLITTYTEKEAHVRNGLQTRVNSLLSQFYKEGINITIDEDYKLSMAVSVAESDLSLSTGQNNSIIFAFIGSVIELAREQFADDLDLSQEFYPLVLDAPLSNFGINVIENFCSKMPDVVEQLILFINDKDGDYVKRFIPLKIGKEYKINLVNLIESKIEVIS